MSEPAIHRWYKGETGRPYHQGKRALHPAALPWVARLRAEKIQPFVRPGDNVLEYGVGLGWNLAELRCAKKVGCDLEPELAQNAARHGIEFSTNPSSLPDESFDVVLCHHMLEHVLSPPDILTDIRRLLKPEGALLLFVPWERERRFGRFDPNEPNHHVYSWNVQTLGNLVIECGFEFVEGRPLKFRFDRFAANLAVKLRLGESGFRLLRSVALLLSPEYEVFVFARKTNSE